MKDRHNLPDENFSSGNEPTMHTSAESDPKGNMETKEQPSAGDGAGDPFSWLYDDTQKNKRTRADAAPIGPMGIACAIGAGFLLIAMIAGYCIHLANREETPETALTAENTPVTLAIPDESESLSADEAPAAFVLDIPETESEEIPVEEPDEEVESLLAPYMDRAATLVSSWSQEQKIGQLFLVTPEALVNKDTIVTESVTQVGEATTNAFAAVPAGGILISAQNQEAGSYIKQFVESFQNLSRSTNGCDLLIVCREEELTGIGVDLSPTIDDANLDEHYGIDLILAASDSVQDEGLLTDSNQHAEALWVPGGFLASYKDGENQKLTSMSSTWAEYNKSHSDLEKLCLMLPTGITKYENPEKVQESIREVALLKDRVVLSCPISKKSVEKEKTTIKEAVLGAFFCGSDQIVIVWEGEENQDTTAPGSSGLNEAAEAIEDALRDGTITWTEIEKRLSRVVALKFMLADTSASISETTVPDQPDAAAQGEPDAAAGEN